MRLRCAGYRTTREEWHLDVLRMDGLHDLVTALTMERILSAEGLPGRTTPPRSRRGWTAESPGLWSGVAPRRACRPTVVVADEERRPWWRRPGYPSGAGPRRGALLLAGFVSLWGWGVPALAEHSVVYPTRKPGPQLVGRRLDVVDR
jgi:hypothetical protein